jgi:hypothetical protein
MVVRMRSIGTQLGLFGLSLGLTIGLKISSPIPSVAAPAKPTIPGAKLPKLEFIGEAKIATGTQFLSTEIGGLSGLTYDSEKGLYYAISDDRGQKGPARIYSFKINLKGGCLESADVLPQSVIKLTDDANASFAVNGIDPEGIAFEPGVGLWVSSEGNAKTLIPPFVRLFSLFGRQQRALELPAKLIPTKEGLGVRDNAALESLTLSPSGQFLYTGTEVAIVQDGTEPTFKDRSPSRIYQFNRASGKVVGEFVYPVEPIAQPTPTPGLRSSGLVELLAVTDSQLLAMERSYSPGSVNTVGQTGMTIRIFSIDLTGATNIMANEGLVKTPIAALKPVQKTLLLDLKDLKIPLDNIEGMTFGPRLLNGLRTLVLVSDNNFDPKQFTQFLAFTLRD